MRVDGSVNDAPVFGFVLLGGPLSGALVRDVRLANELARRGYRVHVWWMLDRCQRVELDPSITEHWLVHALRYLPLAGTGGWARAAKEHCGHALNRMYSEKRRYRMIQKRPWLIEGVMQAVMRLMCEGVERDEPVVHRFARSLDESGVTHIMPMLSVMGAWVAAARRHVRRPIRHLVTFQGYELYSHYARQIGLEAKLHERLCAVVNDADFPAIAVSEDYRRRVIEEVGVPASKLTAIPPGVPAASDRWTRDTARPWLREHHLPEWRDEVPLVTYVGRRDAEKGLDLLLYAAAILRRRGLAMQLVICGPTLFGVDYARTCAAIAENLRIPILWRSYVSESMRAALFRGSDCVVYPSIHREPFGMVAAEAMAHGTPVVVPAYGGVSDAIEVDGRRGGVRFEPWDSGDLANQLEGLLTESATRRRLAEAAPQVAAHFSIPGVADRVLAHMGCAEPATDRRVSEVA